MRSVEEIYQELLQVFTERVGFRPEEGCDLSVRLWTMAAEIQSLEMQSDWVLKQSFPQTAQDIYLDYHGAMRGLERVPATKAVGKLRLSVTTPYVKPIYIPAGTACMTEEEVRFQTTKGAILGAGVQSIDISAEAVESGSNGNVIAGAIRILTACPVAITGCTNPEAFSGGSDEEDDETFRARILESFRRLPNGANAAWYEQTALSYTGVAAAKAVGRARGIGTVDVYVATEAGLPSAELLEGLQEVLQEKREIAVDVEVKAPTVKNVDITLQILPTEGTDFDSVKAEVERVITTYFSGRLLGKPIRLAELSHQVYAVEGVENYRFSAPAQDLVANDAVLPVLGTLTVTEMEA